MKKNNYSAFLTSLLLLPFFVLGVIAAHAQYKISGTVVGDKDKPIKGVNVYLDNTIDGATTDSMGIFSFTTSEKGNQTIMATEMSHENTGMPIVISGDMSGIVLRMKSNKAHRLDEVTITAGSFDASNDKSKTVLRPLDIVTTAGAGADVIKAMEMLPGTQKAGADNGMFVRGGDASEAAIVVDEMIIQNAFFSGPPGVSTRSRFGAFNYQGVSFSSGGYSARYGQALSSVLELNTTDMPEKSNVNVGINMAGVYASGTKKWKKSSIDIGGNYTNTTPFFGLAKTNVNFYAPPQGGSGNVRYVWVPTKDIMLKAGVNGSYNKSGIQIVNPYAGVADSALSDPSSKYFKSLGNNINFETQEQYYLAYISYKQMFKAKYSLYTAASFSFDKTDNKFGNFPIKQQDHRAQFRIEGKRFFTSRLNLLVGTDVQSFGIDKDYSTFANQNFVETQPAAYTELEWTPLYWLAFRPGVRYEHSTLLNTDKIAPRVSMAIKTSKTSQVSLASGIFYQDAPSQYLLAGKTPGMQEAIHYIANWQWNKNDRLLRIEGYYKDYASLILEQNNVFDPNPYRTITNSTIVSNTGSGYAQGVDVFFRDKKTIKNADVWVSYSYIDTRRIYNNFLKSATPGFIAKHNLNLVGKYFVEKWHTSLNATYSYASGRPYYNPNYKGADVTNKFMCDMTPQYHNLALSAAWLHSFGRWFTVFYVSLDNVTNQHNVFGYRYNAAGQPSAVVPPLYRSVFFGINASLSQFSKDEL
ncbi:MAG: TonB-dependent receptor [Flavipsychrobacter sp.]|nr:TonB-dependent receptor [Flavipsychrobacter sp.]